MANLHQLSGAVLNISLGPSALPERERTLFAYAAQRQFTISELTALSDKMKELTKLPENSLRAIAANEGKLTAGAISDLKEIRDAYQARVDALAEAKVIGMMSGTDRKNELQRIAQDNGTIKWLDRQIGLLESFGTNAKNCIASSHNAQLSEENRRSCLATAALAGAASGLDLEQIRKNKTAIIESIRNSQSLDQTVRSVAREVDMSAYLLPVGMGVAKGLQMLGARVLTQAYGAEAAAVMAEHTAFKVSSAVGAAEVIEFSTATAREAVTGEHQEGSYKLAAAMAMVPIIRVPGARVVFARYFGTAQGGRLRNCGDIVEQLSGATASERQNFVNDIYVSTKRLAGTELEETKSLLRAVQEKFNIRPAGAPPPAAAAAPAVAAAAASATTQASGRDAIFKLIQTLAERGKTASWSESKYTDLAAEITTKISAEAADYARWIKTSRPADLANEIRSFTASFNDAKKKLAALTSELSIAQGRNLPASQVKTIASELKAQEKRTTFFSSVLRALNS